MKQLAIILLTLVSGFECIAQNYYKGKESFSFNGEIFIIERNGEFLANCTDINMVDSKDSEGNVILYEGCPTLYCDFNETAEDACEIMESIFSENELGEYKSGPGYILIEMFYNIKMNKVEHIYFNLYPRGSEKIFSIKPEQIAALDKALKNHKWNFWLSESGKQIDASHALFKIGVFGDDKISIQWESVDWK